MTAFKVEPIVIAKGAANFLRFVVFILLHLIMKLLAQQTINRIIPLARRNRKRPMRELEWSELM